MALYGGSVAVLVDVEFGGAEDVDVGGYGHDRIPLSGNARHASWTAVSGRDPNRLGRVNVLPYSVNAKWYPRNLGLILSVTFFWEPIKDKEPCPRPVRIGMISKSF